MQVGADTLSLLLLATFHLLRTTYRLLLSTYYLVLTTCYSLLTVYYYYLLPTITACQLLLTAGRRRYFELTSADDASLLFYDDLDQRARLGGRPARGAMSVSKIQKLQLMPEKQFKKVSDFFKPLTDSFHYSVDLGFGGGTSVGIRVDDSMKVVGAEEGSATEASLRGSGGMEVGDKIVCISGSYVHSSEELEEVLVWLADEKLHG